MTTDEFADSVITYFYPNTSTVLNYPQKSYAVAIIYASLLNQYFGEDLVVALRDPELLYNNDKFFVPYQTDTEAYNNIVMQLTKRGLWEFEKNTSEQVQITVASFKHEFLIDYTSE